MQAQVRRAAALLCAALLAWTVVQRATEPTRANHDVAWHVYAGGVLHDGGTLGVDVVDNNPPLVYWLARGAVALARLPGAAPLLVYSLLAFAVALASTLAARRLLAAPLGSPALADALALALLALLTLGPGFDFAQRDPLVAAGVLPYLVAAGLAADGTRLGRPAGLAVGALAGLGISLKPHYALLWMGVEAWLLLRGGTQAWRRSENAAIVAVGASYVASVLILAPSTLDAARLAWGLYGAYGRPVPLLGPSTGAVVVAAAAATTLGRSSSPAGRVAEALALGSGLALAAAFLPGKDFSYHHAPARLLAGATLAVAAAGWLAARARVGLQDAGAWVVTLGVLALASTASAELRRPALRRAGIVELAALIEREAGSAPVAVLSSSVDPLFPALGFTEARSASPYSCLWLIAGHYERAARRGARFPYRSLEEMGPEERAFVVDFVSRLEGQRPALLLVETTPVKQSFGPTGFDFERYFGADPRFAAWLSGYRPLESKRLLVDGVRTFDVWVRRR